MCVLLRGNWNVACRFSPLIYVRYEVFIAVKIEFIFFWVVAPCSVVVGYQHFRGLSFLHLQG
jgi:hypothetical protein